MVGKNIATRGLKTPKVKQQVSAMLDSGVFPGTQESFEHGSLQGYLVSGTLSDEYLDYVCQLPGMPKRWQRVLFPKDTRSFPGGQTITLCSSTFGLRNLLENRPRTR